jgi:hypothetical protein
LRMTVACLPRPTDLKPWRSSRGPAGSGAARGPIERASARGRPSSEAAARSRATAPAERPAPTCSRRLRPADAAPRRTRTADGERRAPGADPQPPRRVRHATPQAHKGAPQRLIAPPAIPQRFQPAWITAVKRDDRAPHLAAPARIATVGLEPAWTLARGAASTTAASRPGVSHRAPPPGSCASASRTSCAARVDGGSPERAAPSQSASARGSGRTI